MSSSMQISTSSVAVTSTNENAKAISDDEKALYDRQIRLWGIEAQNRLHNSTVLVAGLTGCGCEVAKNLMLVGVKSLTLLDHQKVTDEDGLCQFLISPGSVGESRAEASKQRCKVLNPNVELVIDTDQLSDKNEAYFKKFDLVILIDQQYSLVDKINKICRDANIRFEAGGVFGWIGYAFFDFSNWSFLVKRPKIALATDFDDEVNLDGPSSSKKMRLDDEQTKALQRNGIKIEEPITVDDEEKMKMIFPFPSWQEAWNVEWTHKKLIRKAKRLLPRSYFPVRVMLRMLDKSENINYEEFLEGWINELKNCNHDIDEKFVCEKQAKLFFGPQLSPTCAIIGAHIAQEAVKALSQKDEPLRNIFLFSAYDTRGFVCLLPPNL